MYRNIFFCSVFLFFSSTVYSQSFLVGLMADKSIDKRILLYKNETGSTLMYLPTVHTGKSEYFESIKKMIDSLRKENYLIAYEGLALDTTRLNYEINAKKLRKVIGFHIRNMNEDSKESLPGFYKKKKYLIQNNALLGIDIKKDSLFDATLEDLIRYYENEYGEIDLNEYDLETPLNSWYDMKKNKKGCTYCMTQNYRNDIVLKKVSENKERNIVLLFGKGHKYMLHAGFLENGYTLIKGKL